jgi:hypothetical protein
MSFEQPHAFKQIDQIEVNGQGNQHKHNFFHYAYAQKQLKIKIPLYIQNDKSCLKLMNLMLHAHT